MINGALGTHQPERQPDGFSGRGWFQPFPEPDNCGPDRVTIGEDPEPTPAPSLWDILRNLRVPQENRPLQSPGSNAGQPQGPVPDQVVWPGSSQDCEPPKLESRAFTGTAPLPRRLAPEIESQALASVDLARKYLGCTAKQLGCGGMTGMHDLTYLGAKTNYGQTNMCSNFLSAVLERSQGLKGHYNEGFGLEAQLKKQGWRTIKREEALPGDVWMNDVHVELVSAAGGLTRIGSNNLPNQRVQVVSERTHRPAAGDLYFTRRPAFE